MIAGIDYSMTAPSICICEADEFDIKDCKFRYLTTVSKYVDSYDGGKYVGSDIGAYTSPMERFTMISNWAVANLMEFDCLDIGLEGYSMGSKGKVFDIAENTGLLKYKLWNDGYDVGIYAPTTIKKFATGKGNAKKEDMLSSFEEETGIDLLELFEMKTLKSPVSDIVDSYYIAKYHYENQGT